MTPELRRLRGLFQFWMWLFGGGALLFLVFPNHVIASLDASSKYLAFLNPSAETTSFFWLCLAVSLMVTLTLLCYFVVRNVEASQPFILAVLVSKSTSSLVYFFYYVRLDFPATLFWGALTDGLIFLITFYFFKKAVNAQVTP